MADLFLIAQIAGRPVAIASDQVESVVDIGGVVPVLFERKGREPGEFVGRTPYLQLVHAAGEGNLIGRTANVAINETRRSSLSGVIAAA